MRRRARDAAQRLPVPNIPLVNAMFGTGYAGDERVVLHPDTHYVNREGGQEDKRITDSFFSIVSDTERRYLLECQSTPDNSMIVPLFEYAAQAALDSGTLGGACLKVELPATGVLFLRSNRNTPEQMRIEISTPGGDVAFSVPVLRMTDYTLDDIFRHRLYFLVPFYIFTREAEFAAIEGDAGEMARLEAEYRRIMGRLEEELRAGNITHYQRLTIIEMSRLVLGQIARGHAGIRERVGAIMGGVVLDHESKTVYNEGIDKGIDLGIDRGRSEQQRESLRRGIEAGVDDELLAGIVGVSVDDVVRMRDEMAVASGN